MRALFDELKAAVSGLARTPAFTVFAAGVLGLGLGAVIFMYGVADTLMLEPPPYPNADRLYTIATIDGQIAGDYDDSMLPQDYLKVREASKQFEALGGIYVGTTYLTGDGQAERYDGGFADGHIFDVAGEVGRTHVDAAERLKLRRSPADLEVVLRQHRVVVVARDLPVDGRDRVEAVRVRIRRGFEHQRVGDAVHEDHGAEAEPEHAGRERGEARRPRETRDRGLELVDECAHR